MAESLFRNESTVTMRPKFKQGNKMPKLTIKGIQDSRLNLLTAKNLELHIENDNLKEELRDALLCLKAYEENPNGC
jgi:hypothetical protein